MDEPNGTCTLSSEVTTPSKSPLDVGVECVSFKPCCQGVLSKVIEWVVDFVAKRKELPWSTTPTSVPAWDITL